jgi:hypothetical protein
MSLNIQLARTGTDGIENQDSYLLTKVNLLSDFSIKEDLNPEVSPGEFYQILRVYKTLILYMLIEN